MTNKKILQRQLKNGKKKNIKKLMFWTLGAIFLSFITFVFIYRSSEPQSEVNSNVFQYEKQPAIGSVNAPVKVVEFADFKCTSCKKFDQNIIPQLKNEFLDTGKVKLFFINYPIISPDADSRTAAMAGEAVFHQNPKEFWRFYQAVYTYQGNENANWATSDFLVKIAAYSHINVNYEQMKIDIDQNKFAQDVKEDEDIVRQLGLIGTPTIYINGKQVSENDTFNYSVIREMIMKDISKKNR